MTLQLRNTLRPMAGIYGESKKMIQKSRQRQLKLTKAEHFSKSPQP